MSPDDRKDRLTLTLDWPEITLGRLSRVSGLWAEIVQEITGAAAGKRTAVKWVISEVYFGSPLQIITTPKRMSADVDLVLVQRISANVIDGITHLQQYPDRPPFFSDPVLTKLQKLARQADVQQQKRITVSNGTALSVELGEKLVATVGDLFGPVVESYGTVEGRLEGVFIHGTRRFYIWDSLTNKQVRCDFGERVTLREILDAFERRVAVTGVVRAKARTGERISVHAEEFRVFKADAELPSTNRILELWRQP